MTEEEWATAEDEAISRVLMRLSDRRQRLLAVALVRSINRLASGEVIANAIEVAERFADTQKTKAAMKRSREALADARVALGAERLPPDRALLGAYSAMWVAGIACSEGHPGVSVRETVRAWREAEGISKAEARRRVYPIFREIAGPDTPGVFDSAWRTDTALSLAGQMYESRDFGAMPILADALQDAGCENEHILNHCRDLNAVHVRGCWVVDLVLGKN